MEMTVEEKYGVDEYTYALIQEIRRQKTDIELLEAQRKRFSDIYRYETPGYDISKVEKAILELDRALDKKRKKLEKWERELDEPKFIIPAARFA